MNTLQCMPKISDIILNTLIKNHRPVDYQSILGEIVKETAKPNKTTVYRALESLEKQHKITRANVSDSKSFWEIKTKNQLHIHFICNDCGEVECKPIDNQMLMMPSPEGFSLHKMEINATGTCANCTNSKI